MKNLLKSFCFYMLASKTFTLSLYKSNVKNNIFKYLQINFSLDHSLLAPELLASLIQEIQFYFKLNFLTEKINWTTLAMYLIKRNVCSSFTQMLKLIICYKELVLSLSHINLLVRMNRILFQEITKAIWI